MNEPAIVFYSWQSDLPNPVNRGLIQRALEAAAKAIRDDDSIEVQPVVERDTLNVPGSPQIADTIFEKITRAEVVVADVSFIANGKPKQKGRRPCPNPNVLVELGFAARALGWDRIVLVMNTHFGKVEDLPFDLRMRRTLAYSADPDIPERAEARKELSGRLEAALRSILEQPTKATGPSKFDVAVTSISSGRPDQAAATRDVMAEIVRGLGELNPVPDSSRPADEPLVEALERSVAVVAKFAQLAETIARNGAEEAALAAFHNFEPILERYQFPPRQGGTYTEIDFDFFKFIGHEMFVMLIASMMRHEHWSLLSTLLDEHLTIDTSSGRKGRHFSSLSTYLKALDLRNERLKGRRICLHGDLLKERHEAEPLKSLCSFREFLEADWFLFLRTDLLPDDSAVESRGSDLWRPWSCIYAEGHGEPAFLVKMERKKSAGKILPALGFTDLKLFRERYRGRAGGLETVFRGRGGFFDPPVMDADRIGSA